MDTHFDHVYYKYERKSVANEDSKTFYDNNIVAFELYNMALVSKYSSFLSFSL